MVKITKIAIKHFRSIVEANVELDNFNVFVGLNDAGKSNILKALDLFFNYKENAGRFNFFDNYSGLVHLTGHRAKEIEIAVTFWIPEQYTDHGEITLTRKWAWTKTQGVMFSEEYSQDFTTKARTRILLDRILYEYIPAVKSKDYFQNLLLEMYNTMLTVANSELRDVTNNYSNKLKSLTSDLSLIIKENLNIESYIKMPEDLATLFRELMFETKDNEGNSIKLNSRGDGIQARHIPLILKFIYDRKTMGVIKRSVPYTIIWGYEEPENGVELGACFDMVKELLKYSNDIQMFITSHSPAFYSVNGKENTKVYLTYKDQNQSRYALATEISTIDEHMGLMPIIQPHIQEVLEEYQRREKEIVDKKEIIIGDLRKKIADITKSKIIIITEGVSDVIHLQTAFSQLAGLDTELLSRITYYDFSVESTLGDKVEGVLKSLLAARPKNTIIIGMFDRDKKIITNDRGKPYFYIGGNVYKFNIPSLSNLERNTDDAICIEHYYSNQEIKTEFDFGRLYMANDFDEFGTSIDGNWSYAGFAKNQQIRSYSIIDANSKHIERKSALGKIATKVQFAEYVRDNPTKFNFSNFLVIYNVIKQIEEDDRCKSNK